MRIALVVLFLIAVSALPGFSGGGTTDLSTNSVVLLASPGQSVTTDWAAATAYSQGQGVRSGKFQYFALVGGTSGSTAPTGLSDVTDSNITWRAVLPAQRRGLFLSNTGTGTVTVSLWSPSVAANAGIVLGAGDELVFKGLDETPQGPVSARASVATNGFVAVEW